MAINITSLPIAIYIQGGNGVPTHISPKGTEYTDLDTAIVYINKDGVATWVEFLDSTGSFTGGTVTGATFFSGGLSATTFSATTYLGLPTDVFISGGTYFDGVTNFINTTGGTFNIIGPSNYDAGVLSGATNWVNNNDGSVNLPEVKVALYDNPNNIEPLIIYTISSGTTGVGGIPALTNNDTNYVIIDYNGGSPVYNVLDNDGTVNDSSIVLFMVIYRLNNFVHTLEFGNYGAGLSNKINDRIVMTDRFARESGFSLGLSGSTGVVVLSAGVSWNGTYRQSLASLNSQDDIFFKNFHSGGTWTYTITGDTLNNTFYDNGINLVNGTVGKFLVNWYFRGQEVNDHLYEVYGDNEYNDVLSAEASAEVNPPELITSHAFLVGRIIVGVGQTTGITQSAFSTVFQPSGAAGIHNDLIGIQGGIAGQYYHLDSNKYNNLALTNVNNLFSVGQTFYSGLTASTVSATTYYNLPYYVSSTSPSGVTLSNGSRWYNTLNGSEYVYINDGDSSQWVQPASIPGPQGPIGPVGFSILSVTGITTSSATLTTSYVYYGVNYNGNVNLTLPNPTSNDGFNLNIKDEGGYSGTYRIRITSPIGNVDNNSYVDMNTNNMSLHMVARNNNWWII